jgi:hypothetical protein
VKLWVQEFKLAFLKRIVGGKENLLSFPKRKVEAHEQNFGEKCQKVEGGQKAVLFWNQD